MGGKHGHGSAGAKGSGIDIGRVEAKWDRGSSHSDGGGDEWRGNASDGSGSMDLVQRVKRGGIVRPGMGEATNNGSNRAGNGMTTAAMGKDFAADHIFLVGKFEQGGGGAVQGSQGAGEDVEADGAKKDLGIAQAKRCRLGRTTIFTGTEEVEETDVGHITGSKAHGIRT